MTKINKILESKLSALIDSLEFDNTDLAYTAYVKSIQEDYEANEDDYEDSVENIVDSEQFIAELQKCIDDGDDEIEISYDTGEVVLLDSEVVGYLLDNFNEDDLKMASESPEDLQELLISAFENISDSDE